MPQTGFFLLPLPNTLKYYSHPVATAVLPRHPCVLFFEKHIHS